MLVLYNCQLRSDLKIGLCLCDLEHGPNSGGHVTSTSDDHVGIILCVDKQTISEKKFQVD